MADIKTHEIPFSEVRKRFTEIADVVKYQRECYVFTRNNKPNAVLISPEDFELFKRLLDEFGDYNPVQDREEQLSMLLSNRDRDQVLDHLNNPPKLNAKMKSAIEAAKERFSTDEQ